MADDLKIDHDISDIIATIEATPDANSGDPIADAFTWESLEDHPALDAPVPGELEAKGVTPGGEDAIEIHAPPTPKGSVRGPKVSVGHRGMTDQGLRRSRGVFGEADRRIEARSAGLAEQAEAQAQQSREHYDAIGEAYDLVLQKTEEFQRREQELYEQLIDLNKTHAELEQRLAAEAKAEREAYISAYKEQLAVVKQLALQSGNPIHQLSRGEMIGLAGAQFAQGFLAAQGINIDVAGQVDRWVERSIQEHQLRIQNARTSAEDQLHLYEIARQNSQDEWEARQRYRGFVIAGLQAAIQHNAARFKSDLAMARAMEQNARLQVEADATERAIADSYFAKLNQIITSETDRAYKMGNLAIEQRRATLQEAMFAWDMDPRNPKNAPPPEALEQDEEFVDPEGLRNEDGSPMLDENGNQIYAVRWKVKGSLSKERKKEVASKFSEALGDYSAFLQASETLQQSYLDALKIKNSIEAGIVGGGSIPWSFAARYDKTRTIDKFLNDRREWVIAKIKAESGMQVTDTERKFREETVFLDRILERSGNGEKLYASLVEHGRKGFQARALGFQVEPVTGKTESRPITSPRTGARNQAAMYGEEKLDGLAATQMGEVVAKDNEEFAINVSGSWAAYQRGQSSDEIKLGQPKYAVAVDRLVAAYARPRFMNTVSPMFGVSRDKEETPAEIRMEAYEALSRLARGEKINGVFPPIDAMKYASFMKDKIDADPVLGPLRDQPLDPRAKGQDVEDVEEAPLIELMDSIKR